MNLLGIDRNRNFVAEGERYGGRVLAHMPFICHAVAVADGDAIPPVSSDLMSAKYLFREDSFDPVTRIRRGRIYKALDSQPHRWEQINGFDREGEFSMVTFHSTAWSAMTQGLKGNRFKLALGSYEDFSLWDVMLVERTVLGDQLLTLRSKTTFVPLSEASELAIPEHCRADVQTHIDAAADASRRLDADSTIDACRHAAQSALGAWLLPLFSNARELDIGKLQAKLAELKPFPVVPESVAAVIGRLHVRTKPSEREKHSLRRNEEADGEVALSILGLLLRELRGPPPSMGRAVP